MEASIKGFAVLPTVRRLIQLREAGRIDSSAWQRLGPAELMLLEEPPDLTIWYPIASQGRLLDLLAESLGGSEEAMIEFAHSTADDVLDSPALRVLVDGASLVGSKLGPMLVRMARFGFSFGEWRFEGNDLTDFRVIANDVEPITENVRLNIQGFIDSLASRLVGDAVECHSVRPSPAQILFHARLAATG